MGSLGKPYQSRLRVPSRAARPSPAGAPDGARVAQDAMRKEIAPKCAAVADAAPRDAETVRFVRSTKL
jgi:hypothetical protein